MIGAIFGDIVGSVYEFCNIKTKEFELFSPGCEFTDDTVMTVAVADALCGYAVTRDTAGLGDAIVDSMHRYGRLYPRSDYGGRFGEWLARGDRKPYGSYGNGSAMRVAPVARVARSLEEAIGLAEISAAVTHDHPEGICGAVVTAGAAWLARSGASREEIRDFVSLYYDVSRTLDEIRPSYFFNETCRDTVPQAMQAFFESVSLEDAIRGGVSLGGDSDTLCAITGAVAGAFYGVSASEREAVLSYLDAPLLEAVLRFESVCD